MKREPLRTLLISYGAAGAGALVTLEAIGAVGAIASFWIGGAALALAVSTLRARYGAPVARLDEDAALAASLAAWEADRAAEAAGKVRPARRRDG